jgi:uncharacterized protein YggE
MHLGSFAAALTLIPALAWAQLSPNTVTVTASSGFTAQPDQALFSISVGAGIDKGLDDIVKALAGSGITAANLAGISNQFSTIPATTGVPVLNTWTFQLAVPLANIQSETASLISLQNSLAQNSLAQNNSGLSLSFALQNAQTSGQQFQNCDLGGLVASARAQAQTLAAAAGMTLTAIVSMVGAISQPASSCSLSATFALGFSPQPEPHTITITASRTLTSPPDQVLVAIYINSGLNAGLEDISGAIAAAGISGAAFSGVGTFTDYSSSPQGQSVLQWNFTLTASLAALPGTLAQLGMAQQTISKQNPALSVSFLVEGLQVSPQSQPVCPQAGLISDATAQAQAVATAAGLSAGSILSMSTVAVPTAALVSAGIPAPPAGSGFGYASFLVSSVTSNPASACSLAVQFQLN